MESFIGRKSEISQIEQFCKNDQNRILMIFGENGIGKTTLLNEFAKRVSNKNWVFYFSPEKDESLNNYIFQWLIDMLTGRNFLGGRNVWEKILKKEVKVFDFIKLALNFENTSLKSRFTELLKRVSTLIPDGKLIVFIDPDKDFKGEDAVNFLCFLRDNIPSGVKVILTESDEGVFAYNKRFAESDKVNSISLSGFTESEYQQMLFCDNLSDKFNSEATKKIQEKSKGNPLYIKTCINLINKQDFKDGEIDVSFIDNLPDDLSGLMLKFYESIQDTVNRDIVNWISIVSNWINCDLAAFLTTLSVEKIIDSLKDREMENLIEVKNKPVADTCNPEIQFNSDGINVCKNEMIIKPFHRMFSDTAIKKLVEKGDDLSGRYKRLSAYFLNKMLYDNSDFESLRFYHLYLYRSQDKEAYVKASIGLIERFYSYLLRDSCIEIIERVIKYCDELGDDEDDYVELISKAGIICHEQRHIDKAINFLNRALFIFKKTGNKDGEALVLGNIGIVYRDIFKTDEALKHLEESLNKYTVLNNKLGQSNILTQLWRLNYEINYFDKAIEYLLKLMVITGDLGLTEKLPSIMGNIGNLYCGSSDFDKAVVYYEQALNICKIIGNQRKVASYLSRIGLAYLYNSLYFEALEYFSNSLTIHERSGNLHGEATQCGNIGIAYKKMGELDNALVYFKRALEIFTMRTSLKHAKMMRRNIATVQKMKEEKEKRK